MQTCQGRVPGRGNGVYRGARGKWAGKLQEQQKCSREWRGVGPRREAGDEYNEESGGQCCVGPSRPHECDRGAWKILAWCCNDQIQSLRRSLDL